LGLRVHALWTLLSRRATSSPGGGAAAGSTLLPLPHATVVPGDRFRETYYWDSLWVVRGLLASGMAATAAGLVRNLLHMLGSVGHVPNGARAYYLNRRWARPRGRDWRRGVAVLAWGMTAGAVGRDGKPPRRDSAAAAVSAAVRSPTPAPSPGRPPALARSQPPLLSSMVRAVHAASGDGALLHEALPLLVREHAYWTTGPKAVRVRAADGRVHSLSRCVSSPCVWRPGAAPKPLRARQPS
jgi:neutral trehalase